MYAIVDIETTGGYAAASGITEIAIMVFDGNEIVRQYQTLLNPVYTIPRYVESLTGITNAMVEHERLFSSVADELFDLLNDKIFVAHNVNFDYSFLKYHLSLCGYTLNCKKLCTVRLGRQILPGLPSYSLGNLCRQIGITIENRHRAGGDAEATVKLFKHLLINDTEGHIPTFLKAKSKEQHLPPNLPAHHLTQLPESPGVYYFHDEKGKIIYVGKAKSLSKRVNSHFANNKPARQKQEFLRKIYRISYDVCATELMAFILESVQIRRLWPQQNRSQKRFEQAYALYSFYDRHGYLRLAIEKKNSTLKPHYTFNLLTEGHNLLRQLCQQFNLCRKLTHLQLSSALCENIHASKNCACNYSEPAEVYNDRVLSCLDHLNNELPTFALLDRGRKIEEQSCILMEKGRVYGMGYLPADLAIENIEVLKNQLQPVAENDYIRGLVYQHVNRYPHKRKNILTTHIFQEDLKIQPLELV